MILGKISYANYRDLMKENESKDESKVKKYLIDNVD